MDLMRLPLGILTGVGFIGGGAILRRENMVIGVTTAATLWLATVIGLCLGAGQLGLGIVATALGIVALQGLRWVEGRLRQKIRAHPKIERLPIRSRVRGFEDAAARHADVEVLRIEGIDQDRMQLRTIRRAVLIAAAPGFALRMLVESVHAGPRHAMV